MGVALAFMLILVGFGAVSGFTSDNPCPDCRRHPRQGAKIETT